VKTIFFAMLVILLTSTAVADNSSFAERVALGVDGEHRSDENKARDQYRHPVETLEFFGIEEGSGGWYTEILAPAMRDYGTLIIATWDPEVAGQPAYRYELPKQMEENFDAHPEIYDQVTF